MYFFVIMNNTVNNIPSSSLGVGRDKKEFRQGTFNTKRKDSATAEGFVTFNFNNLLNTNYYGEDRISLA